MGLWWWLHAVAFGAGFYLETPHVEDRSEVLEIERTVARAGHAARIVRRFVDSEGWRFLVRVEGFDEQLEAERVAAALAERLARGIDVLYSDDRTARWLRRHDPGDPLPTDDPSARVDPELNRVAWAVLERAVAAHGVDRDTLTRWMAGPSQLEYRRTLADGSVIDHAWFARDEATLATVRGVRGSAKNASIFQRGDGAWLSVEGGGWSQQDPGRTAMIMADLGPAAAIPFVFALRRAMEGRRELAWMQYAGEGECNGEATHVLGYSGGVEGRAMVLEVGRSDALLRRVTLQGGDVVIELDDYREVDGLRLPFRVSSHREGKLSDVVEIAGARIGEALLETPFPIPEGDEMPRL